MTMEKKPVREIIATVFKALTLAIGIAVVVLSCLGSLETQPSVTLLGIGLACACVSLRCIYMPIVAVVIASVIAVCLGAEEPMDVSNLPSVATGIVLILASLIFRYGAELEQRNRPAIADGENRL